VTAFRKYAWYVLRHKWFVFVECCRCGIVWRGIKHDASKLLPSEWFPYMRFFYGPKGEPVQRRDKTGYYKPEKTGDEAFDFAWLHHQKRNDHHWQWWICPQDDGGFRVHEMSDGARREMLADWRGAGRAQGYGDNTAAWYAKNKDKMILGSETRAWVEAELAA
jgi:hypothetical protein